jgi:hypothetical protein
MTDEILALLWTIGVFLFMGAWIALLEAAKFLLARFKTRTAARRGLKDSIRTDEPTHAFENRCSK